MSELRAIPDVPIAEPTLTAASEDAVAATTIGDRFRRIVGKRRAALYALPQSGATVVAEVVPGQMLDGLPEAEKWVQVAYVDTRTQQRREGWLLKQYAARLTHKMPMADGGATMRRYRQRLLSDIAMSEADIRAGRYTVETPDEHMQWLESVL